MKICGCVMAKNEESRISGCLESLIRFTDKIIVVDNGSTDCTGQIAQNYGCIVLESPDTVVDEGRNKYIDAAIQYGADWLIILDADEQISAVDAQLIRHACETAQDDVLHFQLPWYQYMGNGRFVELLTSSRLFRSKSGIRYNGSRIHSSIGKMIKQSGGKCERLQVPIHHFDMLYENRSIQKRRVYREGLLRQIGEQRPIDELATLIGYLGCEYVAVGMHEKAFRVFEEMIRLLDHQFHYSSLHNAYIYMAQLYLLTGELEKSALYAEALIKQQSHFADRAYSVLAEIALRNKDNQRAIDHMDNALLRMPQKLHLLLNLASLHKKEHPKTALEYLNKAIAINPYLLNDTIYRNGSKINPYVFQCSLLSSYTNVFEHMESCYKIDGNDKAAEDWYRRLKHITGIKEVDGSIYGV